MISPFITAVPLRRPYPSIRATTASSSTTTSIFSIPPSLPSQTIPQKVSINDRLQSLQKCHYLDVQCPTHSQNCSLVCTDIACEHEYRVGCTECLHTSHHGHMIISLDKFIAILSEIQIKECDKSMRLLRDCITDMNEEMDCEMSNATMYSQFGYQSSREKINKSLKIFDCLTRIKKSDLAPLQREKLSDLATSHIIFKQKTQKVFHCANFFAEITYSQRFDTTAWERLQEEKLVVDNYKMLEQEEQVEQMIVKKKRSRKGRRSSKKSQFIFSQDVSRTIQHDGKTKVIWKVIEEKENEQLQENQTELENVEVKIESQEKQIGESGVDKEEEEEDSDLVLDKRSKKMKIAARKRCLFREEAKAGGDQDLGQFEEQHGRKRRKRNDHTGVDIEGRLEDQSREKQKEVIKELVNSEQKQGEVQQAEQRQEEVAQKEEENNKDDWIDCSEQSDSVDIIDEEDEEYSGSESSDDDFDDGNANLDKKKSQELESLLVLEKQQLSNGTQVEEQGSSEIDEGKADRKEGEEFYQSQTSNYNSINNENNNTEFNEKLVSDQLKDNFTDRNRPQRRRRTTTTDKSNSESSQIKSKYSTLRSNLLNEFQKSTKQDRSDKSNPTPYPKCMLIYRYIGPKKELFFDSIYFEEYLQESQDSIIIDQQELFKESNDLMNWIRNTFFPKFQDRSFHESSVIYSLSRQVAHTAEEIIRKKILSMAFINKDVFLTIGQNSEIKLWQINQLTLEIKLLQKTPLEITTTPSRVIVSTNSRSFLLSGELYNDKGCSLFGMNLQTNKTQLLRHYRARSGNVDTPFTGLLMMDKFVVVQKRNQFTRIGLFYPQTKKYIKNYAYLFAYDNVTLVARSRCLLGMSSQISSRIGVLDVISGRDVFLNLPTQGDYYIFAGYGFQNIRGEVYYAVSLTLNTTDSSLDQILMNVPRTGNKYEGEETNSQFRFEIYKLNYLENDPCWERISLKYGDTQVIQMQYSPLLDELIMLEGFSGKNYSSMSFFGYEDDIEMKVDVKSKPFEISRFNIEKKTKHTLLKQVTNREREREIDKLRKKWDIF